MFTTEIIPTNESGTKLEIVWRNPNPVCAGPRRHNREYAGESARYVFLPPAYPRRLQFVSTHNCCVWGRNVRCSLQAVLAAPSTAPE